MSAALSGALEHELKGLNEEIASVSHDAQAKKAVADAKVAEYREAGVNPLVDDSAASTVEALFMEADTAKQRLAVLNSRRDTALRQFSEVVPLKEFGKAGSVIEAIISADGFEQYAREAMGGGRLAPFAISDVVDRQMLLHNIRSGRGIFAGGLFAAGGDGAGLIPIDQRLVPPVDIRVRKLRILDLINIGTTDSNLVEYGKQTVRTDAAAATATPVAGTGVAYSQATYTWTNASANVRDIGHYVKAPRANLSDQGQLQTLLEGQLSAGVYLEAERLVYKGGGTGVDFSGIETEANNANDFITRDTTNERRLIALHRAVTAVRLSLFDEPDAIVLHPTDLHQMISEESTSGGFLLAATSLAQEQPNLWGLPVVATPLATLDEPIVGNYKQGATLWVREGVSLRISDSNEDDFIKRMLTLLAEFRGAYAVQRPAAFCGVKSF